MARRFSTARLAQFFDETGRTDVEIAELLTALHGSRVSPQSISQWRGGVKPNIDLLPSFMLAVGKKVDEFYDAVERVL